jgi:hypothetical protein
VREGAVVTLIEPETFTESADASLTVKVQTWTPAYEY